MPVCRLRWQDCGWEMLPWPFGMVLLYQNLRGQVITLTVSVVRVATALRAADSAEGS